MSVGYLGADRIIWASDYPHPEYEEHVVDELLANTASLDHHARRLVVGDNARAAYRLPPVARHAPHGPRCLPELPAPERRTDRGRTHVEGTHRLG